MLPFTRNIFRYSCSGPPSVAIPAVKYVLHVGRGMTDLLVSVIVERHKITVYSLLLGR